MKNVYLVRTAAVASLAAALLGVAWLGTQSDDMVIAPEMVAVSATAPAFYFPAQFELRANADEPEVFEYY
jgi:hypothetical protein